MTMNQPTSVEDVAYARYPELGQQVGAVCTLLHALPLEAMLAACRRRQITSTLTLPAGMTSQEAAVYVARLRVDERVLEVLLDATRALVEIAKGGSRG